MTGPTGKEKKVIRARSTGGSSLASKVTESILDKARSAGGTSPNLEAAGGSLEYL